MALRAFRGAGPGRAARRRASAAGLVVAVFLAGGVLATWPAVKDVRTDFLAGGAPGYGEASAGDHLQSGYRLWLVGHQLAHLRAPWRDPYTFRPELPAQLNPSGWPFGLAYWPLTIFGAVFAWNAFVLLSYVGAGAACFAWLRALDLRFGAALAGGVAFALAPYRAEQSAGHLLGPVSMLLPLALYAFERDRMWLAIASLASIPLSGQVHLALGAIPFFVLYALCRTRDRRRLAEAGIAALVAIAAGLLVQRAVIAHSLESHGRSLAEVTRYSAEWPDFVARSERHGSESFVLLGWLVPVLAIAGLIVARGRLALALGVGAVIPILLALGTNLPLYSWLWHHFSPLRYPRVPERLMPIACLALAGLAALALDRLRVPTTLALAAIAADLTLGFAAYGASAAGPGLAAYGQIDSPGRILELPVMTPDVHLGSVYLRYELEAQRERPGGYSTLAPARADEVARALRPLNRGRWTRDETALLRTLGVRYIAVHEGVYRQLSGLRLPAAARARAALVAHGWRPVGRDGAVTVYRAP